MRKQRMAVMQQDIGNSLIVGTGAIVSTDVLFGIVLMGFSFWTLVEIA